MKKIPTLFARDPEDRSHVLRDVTPGCEWVTAGEGVATRKFDGTCVMFDGSRAWARREVKPGKAAPLGFVPVNEDEVTGKVMGWEPMEQSGFSAFYDEALANQDPDDWDIPGTYELVGPKINGNPDSYRYHTLVPHGRVPLLTFPRDYDGIRDRLAELTSLLGYFEGVVFWRDLKDPDCDKVKIKTKDFA